MPIWKGRIQPKPMRTMDEPTLVDGELLRRMSKRIYEELQFERKSVIRIPYQILP